MNKERARVRSRTIAVPVSGNDAAGIDRRVSRTKTALRVALLELIARRGYERVSVKDLAARANVGRATFYMHYADKEAVLRENMQALADQIRAEARALRCANGAGVADFSLPMFCHVAEVKPLFVALLGRRGSPVVRELFLETLITIACEGLAEDSVERDTPRGLLGQFLAASFLAVAKWWVLEAPNEDARVVHRRYLALVSAAGPERR